MFRTKPISSNAMTSPKLPITDNVSINVIAIITTRNQQLEQQVFKERESVKAKWAKEWQ